MLRGTKSRQPVGLRKQLLMDDIIISQRFNISRDLGQAAKANDGKPIRLPFELESCTLYAFSFAYEGAL